LVREEASNFRARYRQSVQAAPQTARRKTGGAAQAALRTMGSGEGCKSPERNGRKNPRH